MKLLKTIAEAIDLEILFLVIENKLQESKKVEKFLSNPKNRNLLVRVKNLIDKLL
jgi:hypothetical protein